MGDALKEILGFFSRWCLLGLAVSAVVVVSFAMVLGVRAASSNKTCRVELSDAIWQSQKTPYVVGHIEPTLSLEGSQNFLVCPEGNSPQGSYYTKGRLLAFAGTRLEGAHEVTVKGSPYGYFSFIDPVQSRCLIVSPHEEIYAIDARLYLTDNSSAVLLLDRLLPILQQQGISVFFHPWHLRDLASSKALREKIAQRYPQCLYLFYPAENNPSGILKFMLTTLNRMPEIGPQVITDDDGLLRQAKRFGLRTYSPEQLMTNYMTSSSPATQP